MKNFISLKFSSICTFRFLYKENGFFVLALFFGLIVSATTSYYAPQLRIILIAFIFVFMLFTFLKNQKNQGGLFLFQIILISFILFQYLLNQIRAHDADLASLVAVIIGSLFFKHSKQILIILNVVVILNFLIMVNEAFSGEYFINLYSDYRYEHGRMQGLFSYSKETGFFILSAFLFTRYFSNEIFIRFILFFSAILSGSRTAILFISIILLIDYLYITHKRINVDILKKYFYLVGFILTLYYLAEIYFVGTNEYMLNRILSSFDYTTSSHQKRAFFWTQYLHEIGSYSIVELLFGKGTFLNHTLGNGAESTYLMILSQIGILGLVLFLSPFILALFFLFKKPFKFYPILLLLLFLQVGRIGVGWADGILIWIVLIDILSKKVKVYPQKIH